MAGKKMADNNQRYQIKRGLKFLSNVEIKQKKYL